MKVVWVVKFQDITSTTNITIIGVAIDRTSLLRQHILLRRVFDPQVLVDNLKDKVLESLQRCGLVSRSSFTTHYVVDCHLVSYCECVHLCSEKRAKQMADSYMMGTLPVGCWLSAPPMLDTSAHIVIRPVITSIVTIFIIGFAITTTINQIAM